MGFNTYPYSPFPASTEQLHKGDNEDLQAQINAIKDGATLDSFADVESALELKQDATDNSFETTDKTVVGAVNELKSGLINVDVALSVPEGSGVNLFNPSGYETFDITGGGEYRYGHSFDAGEYYVVAQAVNTVYCRIVKADLSDLGTTVNITTTPQKVTIPNGYKLWVFSNEQSVLVNACVSKYSTPYVAYVPSVESRIEAVESGVSSVSDGVAITGLILDQNVDGVIDDAKVFRFGKLIVGNIRITLNDAVSASQQLIHGLPKMNTALAAFSGLCPAVTNKPSIVCTIFNESSVEQASLGLANGVASEAGVLMISFSYVSV